MSKEQYEDTWMEDDYEVYQISQQQIEDEIKRREWEEELEGSCTNTLGVWLDE